MGGEAGTRLGRKYYENINYKIGYHIFDLMGSIFFYMEQSYFVILFYSLIF